MILFGFVFILYFKNLVLQLLPKRVSASQIAGFFDQQYFGEETIDIYFLHGDIRQGKVTPDTTTSGWVRLVLSGVQSDCRILVSAISLEQTNGYIRFFSMEVGPCQVRL